MPSSSQNLNNSNAAFEEPKKDSWVDIYSTTTKNGKKRCDEYKILSYLRVRKTDSHY